MENNGSDEMMRKKDRQDGEEAMTMSRTLFEGGPDLTPLQWLRGAVVVHHAAGSLSVTGEEQAAELRHLMGEKK